MNSLFKKMTEEQIQAFNKEATSEMHNFALKIEELRNKVCMTYLIIYIQPLVYPDDVEEYHKYGRKWSEVEKKLSEIHQILGTTPDYKSAFEKVVQQLDEKRTDN